MPLGDGHVELVGQYRAHGYDSNELRRRRDSLRQGLVTLQITPVGAFGLQVLHDLGKSGGDLVPARYLAELPMGRVAIYPGLGAEYQSRKYTCHHDGTTAADAAAEGQAYRPGSAVNPYLGAWSGLD